MALSEAEELELLELEEEEYQQSIQGSLPSVQPRTIAEQAVGALSLPKVPSTIVEGMNAISPFPTSMKMPSNVQEGVKSIPRIGTAPLMMEAVGERIGDIGMEASGGIAEKSGRIGIPPIVGATAGTIAGTVSELAKPTFSNVMMTTMGEMSPKVIGHLTEKLPSSITNRFLKSPESITNARLNRGEATTGEVFLKNKVLNPEGIGELPTSDKTKIYDVAKDQISKLGGKAKKIIDDVVGDKSTESKNLIDKSKIIDRKEVFDNVVDEMIGGAETWDISGKELSILNKIKNSNKLDFKTANEFREILGSYVGKRFGKDEVPEKIDAMIGIFGKLRDKIGKTSPELDDILKQQHNYFDIMNSVKKVKARGYQDSPLNLNPIDLFGIPKTIKQSPKIASILETIPKTRGVGSLPPIIKQGTEINK